MTARPKATSDIASEDPALLVAFAPYYDGWRKSKYRFAYRDWALDSGAFGARQHGIHIDIIEYIEHCKHLLETDPTLVEIFALDVIGDWRATMKNTEMMWAHGVEAIPCYHFADDNEGVLLSMARDYPKIALGGMADLRGEAKYEFAQQCFSRVWPKRVHGFAVGDRRGIMALPWHSVDASSWKQGALRFGRWLKWGRLKVRSHASAGVVPDLRPEIEAFLQLERRHRAKWLRVMRDGLGPDAGDGLTLRLAADWPTGVNLKIMERALGKRTKEKRIASIERA